MDISYRPMPGDIVKVPQLEELFEVVEVTDIAQLARLIETGTNRTTQQVPWANLSLHKRPTDK